MVEQADVIVVGMGPGGEEVAGRLAEAGLDVVGIESTLLGGECPYWACVPTKMMVRATDALAEARRVPSLAGSATVAPDWAPVARRIREEATDNWDDAVAVKRFEDKGGRFVRGAARLTGPRGVEAAGRQFSASRALVLAIGSRPQPPPVEGLADTPYWTNRDAVEATVVPSSLVVVGGGAVGVEFAQVFARFGCDVTLLEAAERLLVAEEPESSQLVATALERDGVHVVTGARVESVAHDGDLFTLRVGNPTGTVETVRGERCLVATGRRPDLTGLGVGAAGLDAQARVVEVDEHLRAGPGIWAVGDVTGRGAFTHVAVYQARIAAADILGRPHQPADYRALPRVTFTDPEVGAVGLTEAQAHDAGVAVATSCLDLRTSARGWIHKVGNDGFVKLVADRARGVLVGATTAGPSGGEVLGALAVAVHAAVPVAVLAEMIYAYPTFHRAIGDAVEGLR